MNRNDNQHRNFARKTVDSRRRYPISRVSAEDYDPHGDARVHMKHIKRMLKEPQSFVESVQEEFDATEALGKENLSPAFADSSYSRGW